MTISVTFIFISIFPIPPFIEMVQLSVLVMTASCTHHSNITSSKWVPNSIHQCTKVPTHLTSLRFYRPILQFWGHRQFVISLLYFLNHTYERGYSMYAPLLVASLIMIPSNSSMPWKMAWFHLSLNVRYTSKCLWIYIVFKSSILLCCFIFRVSWQLYIIMQLTKSYRFLSGIVDFGLMGRCQEVKVLSHMETQFLYFSPKEVESIYIHTDDM